VTAKLKLDWSPEAIAGRLQVDYPDNEKGEGALVTSVTYSQCILIYYFLDVLLGSSPESNDMAGSFIKAFTLSTYN
jgi:hypothetical protein